MSFWCFHYTLFIYIQECVYVCVCVLAPLCNNVPSQIVTQHNPQESIIPECLMATHMAPLRLCPKLARDGLSQTTCLNPLKVMSGRAFCG